MTRTCYCTKILPGKQETILQHWIGKKSTTDEKEQFWRDLKMTGFECWIQPSSNLMIHCLEGESKENILKGLREQIRKGHPIATGLNAYYLEVLGMDYSLAETEPKVESLFDIELSPFTPGSIKRAFVYPLLPNKEEEHRKFREGAMGKNRVRHEASMRSFGVTRMSVWLQSSGQEKYIVFYQERKSFPKTSVERLSNPSPEWREISEILVDHTGLRYQDLSPEVTWLTKS